MIYYRIALQVGQTTTWRWKSPVLASLYDVLGLLKLYSCVPKEHIRVFLSTATEENLEEMLQRENVGALSTALTVDQLWDKNCMNGLQLRRLELELGAAGDHDCPYTFTLPTYIPQILAWTELLARVQRGEIEH